MNKSFIIGLHLFLLSSLSHADVSVTALSRSWGGIKALGAIASFLTTAYGHSSVSIDAVKRASFTDYTQKHESIPEGNCTFYYDYLRQNSLAAHILKGHPCPNPSGQINLAGMNIGATGAQAIAPALMQLADQQAIYLQSNNLGDDGIIALAPALLYQNDLSDLYAGNNNIGSAAMKALANAIFSMHDLQQLSLGSNNFGPEGASQLAWGLTLNNCLITLDVSNNSLGTNGTIILAPALNTLPLTSLDISNNGFGSEALPALAAGLKNCTQLNNLNLANNPLGPVPSNETQSFCKVLGTSAGIDLSSNGFGDSGATIVGECFGGSQVNMSDNSIGNYGMTNFSRLLGSRMSQFYVRFPRCLDFSYNNIGDKGVSVFSQVIYNVSNNIDHYPGESLSIYLHDNVIGGVGSGNLADSLVAFCKGHFTTLFLTLDLSDNGLNSSTCTEIQSQLAQACSLSFFSCS